MNVGGKCSKWHFADHDSYFRIRRWPETTNGLSRRNRKDTQGLQLEGHRNHKEEDRSWFVIQEGNVFWVPDFRNLCRKSTKKVESRIFPCSDEKTQKFWIIVNIFFVLDVDFKFLISLNLCRIKNLIISQLINDMNRTFDSTFFLTTLKNSSKYIPWFR